MLRELEVRDLGIIDAVRLELPSGFVVLTGETGAGKSLLVQSLQLLAGERADSEQVRGGCERLLVQGCFERPRAAGAGALLDELGVSGEAELVVRREVTASRRSRAWINDVPVTAAALQRLARWLLAIHGQHEQRGLADPGTHLALVDAAGAGLAELRARVGEVFSGWQRIRDELAAERRALASRRDRLDTLAFQLQEIGEARVVAGEDVELGEERALLRHVERIRELLAIAQGALGGDGGAVALARAARAARELAALGVQAGEIEAGLEQARLLAEDAERDLVSLAERTRVDPSRLEAVEARLATLERLARKYGGSLDAVIAHQRDLLAERERLATIEDDIARLGAEEERAARDYTEVAVELSRRRAEAATGFAREVVAVLARLGMARARFELRLERRAAGERSDASVTVDGARVLAAADGIDVGELIISPNPGEEPRALVRIASGGELSRVHLAIRTVLRERIHEDALTLLFDEVDAGIGGKVADELGELLAEAGRRDQVLVVTHLPQVAARASSHFAVRKEAARGRTVTRVERVDGAARVDELVRLLGGGPETPSARAHARELLRLT